MDASLLHADASQFSPDLEASNSLPVPQKFAFVLCDEHFGISQQAAFFSAASAPATNAELGFKNSSPQAN